MNAMIQLTVLLTASIRGDDSLLFVALLLAALALIISVHYAVTRFKQIREMFVNYIDQYYSMLSGSRDEE